MLAVLGDKNENIVSTCSSHRSDICFGVVYTLYLERLFGRKQFLYLCKNVEQVMYKVTGYFKDHKVVKTFHDLYDAIDFRDSVDANYPKKVKFEKVKDMREWIYNCWNVVMDDKRNPLSNIPDFSTRHMIMQVLAWMWCIVFAIIVSSMWAGVISMIIHALLLGAIAVTVATFETAKRRPSVFYGLRRDNGINSRGYGGEHE